MAQHYSAEQVVGGLPGLSRDPLDRLVRGDLLRPVIAAEGLRFREIDVARLRLALDLSEHYGLDDDSLSLVLSLVDQLNDLRGDMRAVLAALATEPPETRARLRTVITRTRVVVGD